VKRRLAAILAADVVGYSRLMGRDEVGTLRVLIELRQNILEPLIGSHKGRIVKLMGDGLLVEFASVVDAVECALAWQDRLEVQKAGSATADDLQFRIGINLGDIIVEGSDIYGDGVNISVRLEQLALPGGICISGAAKDQVSAKVDAAFEPIGLQSLKNIAEPVPVYRIKRGSEGAAGITAIADFNLKQGASIAVLPFQNMSADQDQEFFADGLTEDIITRLSYLRDVFVISRTSAFAYKGRAVRVQDVANELGVDHVLEGSVRKAGNRIRITAQLINGKTGGHLWAQRYDRELDDIFAVQDVITHAIVVAMQVKLTDGEVVRRDVGGTQIVDAWEFFQQGVAVFLKYTPSDNRAARHYFQSASKADPAYLDAKIYLAWTHWMDAHREWSKDVAGSVNIARKLFDEVTLSDTETINAKYLEAVLFLIERRYDDALVASEVAVDAGQCRLFGYAPAAKIQIWCDNPRSALELCRASMRLSPFCPVDVLYHFAYALIWIEDHNNAIVAAKEYGHRNPGDAYAYTLQATAFAFAGERENAVKAIQALLELFPDFNLRSFSSHELYRDQKKLDRVVACLREAGLPE